MLRRSDYRQPNGVSGIDYNNEIYAEGTSMDRIGRRMNASNVQYGANQQTGYYNAHPQGSYYASNNPYQQTSSGSYYGGNNTMRSPNGNTGFENQSNSERVERIVYKSAVPTGDYHNLDDPKNDVRRFGERSNDEK